MKRNDRKLVVGDLVRFSPSLIGLIYGFGYSRFKSDAEFYIVKTIGRKYYHLFSYDRETLGGYHREIFKVDMDLLDDILESNQNLITAFHPGEDEYTQLHSECIHMSMAELKKRAKTQSDTYCSYRGAFLKLLRNFNSEEDNPVMAKVLLAV